MLSYLQVLIRDVWRSLRGEPVSAGFATISLAVGICTTASVLGLVDSTMLRPLPYPRASQIVELVQPTKSMRQDWYFTYRFFREAQGQLPQLESLAALSLSSPVLELEDHGEVLKSVGCSASLFDLLDVKPLLGRTFDRDEELPNKGVSVALISEERWRKSFGSNPEIIGQTLRLNDRSFEVIGILSGGMKIPPFQSAPDVWIPFGADPNLDEMDKMFPGSRDRMVYLRLWAGILPGAGNITKVQETVRAAVIPLLSDSEVAKYRPPDAGFALVSVKDKLISGYRFGMYILLLAALLTFLVAWANVSAMILSRSISQRKYAAIRAAVGASRSQICGCALLEAAIITLSGTMAGLVLSKLALRGIETRLPLGMLPFRQISLGSDVLAAVLIGSLFCGTVIAIFPAMRLGRVAGSGVDLWGRSTTESRSMKRSREVVVIVQIACATLSVLFFMVLYKTYRVVSSQRLGLSDRGVIVANLTLPRTTVSNIQFEQSGWEFARRAREEPHVEAASVAISAPLTQQFTWRMNCVPANSSDEGVLAEYRPVSAGYFSVLGVPILRGQCFLDSDRSSPPAVCLINETLARTQFPNGDAVGRRITINQEFQSEVIGVVGDVAAMSPSDPPAPAIYVPFYRMPLNAWFMSVLVRTGGEGVGGAQDYKSRTLERKIHELAPGFAVQVVSMRGVVDERSAAEGFRAIVMGAVTLIATMLASLGVYGITAHYVKQRRREIAIQMALGATPSRIILAIELRAILLAVAGILLASIATYPTLKFLRGLLFGMAGLEVSTVTWAAGVVSILVMLAAYLPSREVIKLTLRDLLTDN